MSQFREDDPSDMLALEMIVEMYEAVEQPFVKMSTDGVTTLLVPQTVRKLFPIPENLRVLPQRRAEAGNAQPITGEETRGIRLPNGAGAING